MKRACSVALLLCLSPLAAMAAETELKPGDFVAVVGDSITEQKQYSVFVEDYLLMCQPVGKLRAAQFGWGGETAAGFSNRMQNDMLRFQPSVVTTCFGMNDGGYSPMTPQKAQGYRDAQRAIVQKCKQAGVRAIVVGSPGCVDFDTFRNNPEMAVMYNKTLGELRDIAREVAKSEDVDFADVYAPMIEAMTKAKEKYGKTYHLAGGDGFHPDQNGHLVMAYAFLKGLGCTGEIAKIDVDLGSNKTEVSSGHKVLSTNAGAVEIESSRYPFCFYGDATKPGATRGVVEFFPFNKDLNRFMLTVKGASGGKYKITWGKESKEFSSSDLAGGINLAAEFLDNPFSEPFQKVEAKIRRQQNIETPLIKSVVHGVGEIKQQAPDQAETVEKLAAEALPLDKALFAESAAAVTPVRHMIVIEAVK